MTSNTISIVAFSGGLTCPSKIHFNTLKSYDEDPGPPKQNTIQNYVTEENTFIELDTFSVL